MLGRLLAREAPVDADVVVPVPDSGVAAAIGYASEAGIPFRQALIRNHYVGRTFIEPSQAIRDFGVKLKLNPVRHLLDGRRVIVVDDSIVRGTTSRKIVRMVRGAGAREVHLRVSGPPTVSPCFYGVDTPSLGELIAANQSVEQIRRFVEADSLSYLSLGALRQAVADERHDFCYACYTGEVSNAIGEYRRTDCRQGSQAIKPSRWPRTVLHDHREPLSIASFIRRSYDGGSIVVRMPVAPPIIVAPVVIRDPNDCSKECSSSYDIRRSDQRRSRLALAVCSASLRSSVELHGILRAYGHGRDPDLQQEHSGPTSPNRGQSAIQVSST
jgi:hypothetical protein